MRGVHSVVDDIRRNVFTEVAKIAYEGGDYSCVDLIPYKLVSRKGGTYRHDIFLERAVVQERVRLACGLPVEPIDVRAPASAGIKEAVEADNNFFEEPLVNVVTFACNACPPNQVRITDNCQGCISHPCMNVCPKDAIWIDENQHSVIDQDKCIKCGRCVKQCPYQAISHIERPCAAACGMDAIESDENGCAKINYDKCVSCGMCLVNCPFAAIADKSQILQVISAMKEHKVVACVAPAFVGQFGKDATPAKLKTAMRMLGFDDVVEVAIGADLCTIQEAHDFIEEVPAKIPWMGTSCCPAWSMMVKKAFPQFKENISMALTPMVITARVVKNKYPDVRICFIGPCAAKKLEANRRTVRSEVDYVLTFEELQGMFDAKSIDFATLEADPADNMNEGTAMGRGFAVSGGVAGAVAEALQHIAPDREVKIEQAAGLKECQKMIFMARAGKRDGYLLEGMACPGGCVAGAGTIAPIMQETAHVKQFAKEAPVVSCVDSPYADELKNVEE